MNKQIYLLSLLILVFLLPMTGCDNMRNSNRLKANEKIDFFEDKNSSRELIDGVVPRGLLPDASALNTGKNGNQFATGFPFEITKELLDRGQERYDIFCSMCHGKIGDGNGMVTKRGFPAAKSFHDPDVKKQPNGYYFDVITNGMGKMAGFYGEVNPSDRWAIIAYMRTLQYSQSVDYSDLKLQEKNDLNQSLSAKSNDSHKELGHH